MRAESQGAAEIAIAAAKHDSHPSYIKRTVPEWRLCEIGSTAFADLMYTIFEDSSDEET